jgi:hypothetical protein
MVDVLGMPDNSFGTVPTPAIVAPIEFTMTLADYTALGGHTDYVRTIESVLQSGSWHPDGAPLTRVWQPVTKQHVWPIGQPPMLG